mgnify:CR=1 FL=1
MPSICGACTVMLDGQPVIERGKIVGDIKLTFTSASAPQSIDVRVWPDLFAQACNADYRKPAADVTVEVPADAIATTVSGWLAELGADSPLVGDLQNAVNAGDWPAAPRHLTSNTNSTSTLASSGSVFTPTAARA